MSDSRALLLALEHIRARVAAGDAPRTGICWAVRDYCADVLGRTTSPAGVVSILDDLCRRWPENSGHANYPVPAVGYVGGPCSAYREAQEHGRLWRGDYGDARGRLLDFCIGTLREGLKV